MRVLMMRHGEAISGDEAYDEASRWLTPAGRRVARMVASSLASAGTGLSRVFTSPLTRAVQTAEILASAHAFEGPITVWPGLASGSIAHALEPLDESAASETIALVGHMPLIASMASHLIGSRMPAFKPATVCSVVRDSKGTRLEWVLDPDTLRQLGPRDLHLD